MILIAGGSGLVGKALQHELANLGLDYGVLSRRVNTNDSYYWNPSKGIISDKILSKTKVIVNLSGENIAKSRWTDARKRQILNSRVDTITFLFDKVKSLGIELDAFISASAVGYYGGITSDKIFNENDLAANDFLGQTCSEWERSVDKFLTLNTRVVKLRIGVVLSKYGGAFDKIALPIKFGVGSPLGSGKQYMPWIHEEDLARLIVEVVKNKSFNGVYNAVAPKHITNSEFINKVAEKMSRPLFLPPVPEFLLKLIFGEMSVVITKGSRVSAEKLLATGFSFRYDSSEKAIDNLLSQ